MPMRHFKNREKTMKLIGIAKHSVPKGPMEELQQAIIKENWGLVGDSRAKAGSKRQITVLSYESWLDACVKIGEGKELPWIVRRANLLITGKVFRPRDEGKCLQIGDILLLITGECDPCARMDAQVAGLTRALTPEWRGGAICQVIRGGEICLSMEVALLEAPP